MPAVLEGQLLPPPGRFALCVSRFNELITDALLKGALDALLRHGVAEGNIDVVRCSGTFELGPVVKRVATSGRYRGVVALGCVIRGGTPHFEYVAGEVAKAIGQVALSSDCAVTFGVLTCDTAEQALDRAGLKSGNKGHEAALACLEQVNLFAVLAAQQPK